ncbi:MAG TPA: YggT family protein [Nitrospinota bacterium]|jgi:YggT family protein|nr:YggT family protein [Nitrospinota bacterium]|tara:strand:- start:30261 stop:30557 length:297 start_codon:yes stop_codon:yes gene_type:complete
MFIIGNFLIAIAQVINIALTLYLWTVIIRALISWVNPDPYNPIVTFLYRVTEPALRPIQKFIPMAGGIDFSPVVLILVIYFMQFFLVTSLMQIGQALQ